MERLIALAQKWVMSKNKGDCRGLGGAWFSSQGQWISPIHRRVRVEVDSTSRACPAARFWAMRYEHPDLGKEGGATFRQWRTDLSLATAENLVLLSMQISHYLLPGHFGPEPPAPEPSSPLLVKNILRSSGLVAFAGSQPITAKPIEVTANDAELLVERILDPHRLCPLIYISRSFSTGEPVVDPSKLAWSLAGLAAVYVAESSWLDKATETLLPTEYRCWNGRVRVYLPKVSFDQPQDSRRHRYFTSDQVMEQGVAEVERIIVQSLARRVTLSSITPALDIDDVRRKRQEDQFERLKNQLASAPSAEMLELLESINRDLEHKLQIADSERKGLADQLELARLEIETRDDELKKGRYLEDTLRAEVNQERERRRAAEVRAQRLTSIYKLPESIEECCRVLAEAFPGRIEFTGKALESARTTAFSKVNLVWTALWHVANTLHPLAFSDDGNSVDLEDEFLQRSGIRLALSEGKLTKANAKIMQSRSQQYNGEKIDITPHIKLEASGKHLRIHLHIHKRRRIIIIGHCGDHLDTAGTAKKK
jgi:hypothetical protein